jgi:RNA polymerase-binding protein DksA
LPSQNPAASNGGVLTRLPKPQYKFLLECFEWMIAPLARMMSPTNPLRRRKTQKTTFSDDRQHYWACCPDQLDQTQLAVERELAISRLDRDSPILQSLDAALRRIERGTYGYCLQCEEEISLKRLQAVPWTSFCLDCQEEFDRSRRRSFSDLSPDDELIIRA